MFSLTHTPVSYVPSTTTSSAPGTTVATTSPTALARTSVVNSLAMSSTGPALNSIAAAAQAAASAKANSSPVKANSSPPAPGPLLRTQSNRLIAFKEAEEPEGLAERIEQLRTSQFSSSTLPSFVHHALSSVRIGNVPYCYSDRRGRCHIIPSNAMPMRPAAASTGNTSMHAGRTQGEQVIFDGSHLRTDEDAVFAIGQLYAALGRPPEGSTTLIRYPAVCALRFENCSDHVIDAALKRLIGPSWHALGPYIRTFEVAVDSAYRGAALSNARQAIDDYQRRNSTVATATSIKESSYFKFIVSRAGGESECITNQTNQAQQ